MPTATANPVAVDYRILATSSDMGEALEWATSFGLRGTIEMFVDENSVLVRHIELVDPTGLINPLPITAFLGDVLVWNGVMNSMTQDFFNLNYTP